MRQPRGIRTQLSQRSTADVKSSTPCPSHRVHTTSVVRLSVLHLVFGTMTLDGDALLVRCSAFTLFHHVPGVGLAGAGWGQDTVVWYRGMPAQAWQVRRREPAWAKQRACTLRKTFVQCSSGSERHAHPVLATTSADKLLDGEYAQRSWEALSESHVIS